MELLVSVLLSTPALTLYAIVLVILIGVLVNKNLISKKYIDISVDLFSYIEDNYKTWGIQGNEKLSYFITTFVAKYKKDTGIVPTQEIIENAVKIVEELVGVQNDALKK
ncbi:MAG: hypothetical protein A2Y34_04365 [Spirochaetes bacterium GWC1_27_15]|nr:MAG: hypothetical protein A2Y34_04365 [Spirochaetes bacterium GWC1_27_15]